MTRITGWLLKRLDRLPVPPRKHLVAMASMLGILGGLGGYTFIYAEGFAYFSAEPKVCANCHIMNDQYDSWLKGTHHAAAKCVDCHLPTSFVPMMIAKTDNGYRHSKGFTLQDFHEPIMITPRNSRILHDNCVRCHEGMVHEILVPYGEKGQELDCIHCHVHVGHGARK